jgi:transcriptional regulator with XRE-family HTH domain
MAGKSRFNQALKEKMLELYRKGKTDKQIAEIIGVSDRTINNWKRAFPTFLQALKESKQIADDLVEASLFSRAVGYSHPEEKVFCNEGQIVTHDTIKQYPPDTTAAIFWLKNRQPQKWRENYELKINPLATKSDEELDQKLNQLLEKLAGSENGQKGKA